MKIALFFIIKGCANLTRQEAERKGRSNPSISELEVHLEKRYRHAGNSTSSVLIRDYCSL